MKLMVLVGAGGRVMGGALPFMVLGVAANIIWPAAFVMGSGIGGLIRGHS